MCQAYNLEMLALSILKPSQAEWELCSVGDAFSASGWLVLNILW